MEIFDKLERVIAIALLILMGIVVAAGVVEVAYVVFSNMLRPPGFFIGVEDLFDIFGLFLMILIGLELMASIRTYFDENRIHAEVMFLVALTAVARKVVILDAKALDPMTIFSIAALVFALAAGFYLIKRPHATGPR